MNYEHIVPAAQIVRNSNFSIKNRISGLSDNFIVNHFPRDLSIEQRIGLGFFN